MTDIEDYADLGANVRCILRDASHSVWRAEGDDGQGVMTMYDVMPGIVLMFNSYTNIQSLNSALRLMPESRILCLIYCREGRIERELDENTCLYLGAGDLRIDDYTKHAQKFRFPFGHYRGVTVCLLLDDADRSLQSVFPDGFPVSVQRLYDEFCADERPVVLHGGPAVEHIFSEMYSAQESFRDAYLKLKVMELLLFLGERLPRGDRMDIGYLRRSQVDKAKAIERAITADLTAHKTLEQLSAKFDFPYASMQRCFKEVYGTSIHAYLTRYRMTQAAMLLRTTSKPVYDVALSVGYASASKFAAAFRDVVGSSPSAYREGALQER